MAPKYMAVYFGLFIMHAISGSGIVVGVAVAAICDECEQLSMTATRLMLATANRC